MAFIMTAATGENLLAVPEVPGLAERANGGAMVTDEKLKEQIAKVVAEEPVSALVSMKALKYYGWKADLTWSQETPEQRQLAWLLYKGYRWVDCSAMCLNGMGEPGKPCEYCSGAAGEWVKEG